MLAGVAAAVVFAVNMMWGHESTYRPAALMAADVGTALPYYTVTVASEVATVAPTVDLASVVAAEMAKQRKIEALMVAPTATVEAAAEVVYIEVPYEVTRLVEVFMDPPVVLPTPTTVFAPGSVSICIDAAGVKELYVAGVGVVGGGCHLFQVGAGTTYVEVQVNR